MALGNRGNRALIEIIRREIAQRGALAFSDFMQLALYEPQHGYYASGRAEIGRSGDFFTNVSVGALFGKLLAGQFAEMWERLGKPCEFSIVEQGANNGQFAHDVLSALKISYSDLFASLRYVIVEPFPVLRARQREMLAVFPQVAWRDSLDALEPFVGVHFSNELIDAMPVRLVTFADGEWHERKVAVSESGDDDDNDFHFVTAQIDDNALRDQLAKIPLTAIPEGYETEVNLAAHDWLRALTAKLQRGYALAIDYGFPREIYYSAERKTGTLACYANHRRGENPLTAIGEADITAHVEFTSVIETARACGLDLAGFTDQHHFMVGLGALAFPDRADAANPLTAIEQKERRAFTTLMHPQMMGLSFKALALAKSAPISPSLAGFTFAR